MREAIFEAIGDAVSRHRRTVRNAIRWIQCRTGPGRMLHWVKTDLEPSTWHDADHRMLHACFCLLCSFVEEEHGGESKLEAWAKELEDNAEPWEEATRLRESLALYRWWKIEKGADCMRRDDMLHSLFREPEHGTVRPKERTSEWESRYADFKRLEQKIDEDEQSMLHRLIDIRTSLWT